MDGSSSLKVYNVTVPIKGDQLVVQVRGDQHYGAVGIDKDKMFNIYKEQQDLHRDNLFVIDTGDLLENNLNNSIGHGYDVAIKDPQIQISDMAEVYTELNRHLYGTKVWDSLKFDSKKNIPFCRHAGVFGNHEYRSRKTAGVWILDQVYGPSKTLNLGVRGLLNLKVVNTEKKLSKTYKLFISHRPSDSSSGGIPTILRNCTRVRADINADVYVFGHYHKRMVWPEFAYDENGVCRKVLYVVNPSPMADAEYAQIAGFAPVESAWFVNFFLPIDKNLSAWSHV